MQKTTKSAFVLMLLLIMSAKCFALGLRYPGDLADAWFNASIVVLGRPNMVRTSDIDFNKERETYAMDIQRAYKGAKPNDRIEFIDQHFGSTAALHIQKGSMYLVFLQTKDDRKERPHPAEEGLGEAISCLRVFRVDDKNLGEIEAGIATVRKYETLAPQDRKAFLLQNLVVTNAYSHTLIVREILHAGIKEAVPYFQQRLSQATNETDKLNLISYLRCLGEPSVKATLLSWLSDDSFQKKSEIIREMAYTKDLSFVPTIRKYIDVKDEYVAVTARSALLELGESDAKSLLLDMIKKSNDPVVRYNAIHQLNWGYSGDFTDEEKAAIRDLVHDKDPTIARVAGFIVKKWKPISNKPSEATLVVSEGATFLREYATNGVCLTAGFIPDSTEIILGEPLFVTFVVSNPTDQSFRFSHVRNEIFSITATNAAGQPVKNLYFGLDGNGFVSEVIVPPGKAHTMRLFLNERCRFEQPGDYTVNCRCNFWYHPHGSNSLSQPIITVFRLRVDPIDPTRISELIEMWGRSILTNGSPQETARALAEFNDVRTIPYLAVLVTNSSDVSYLAVNALTRYTNETAAVDALTVALKTGEDHVSEAAGRALRNSHQADRVARALLPILTNADASVRIQTARAISWTGSELAFAPLCTLLGDENNSVRYAAAQAIGRLGAPQSFMVLTNCLTNADFTLRIAAVKGLISLGRQVEPEWVKPMILSGGENIRTYYDAIDLLRLHGGSQAAHGLASCLHFDNPSVRHSYNFRLILALEYSSNGPKYYYKWHSDPNRDGTEQELAENRQILSELKAWLNKH